MNVVNPSGATPGARLDRSRTARLLFDAELEAGAVAPAALSSRAVRRASAVRGVPPRPIRLAQQLRYKLGGLRYESGVARPLIAARRAVLGARSESPPRFLVRVDEFPHYKADDEPGRFGSEAFERFHAIMHGAGVAYLIAVLPRVSHEPLSPTATGSRGLAEEEVQTLSRLCRERVTLAMHGLDHRTRFASPRRHSELCGLRAAQLEQLLDAGLAELARHELRPQVFVPPYNRFDASQFAALARRFQIVCGGPESIGLMGFQRTPQWRGESVYLPSYGPLYGRCGEVLEAVERMIEQGSGLWTPVVLHWGWEAEDGWADLERLAERIGPYAAEWQELIGAVARAREPLLAGGQGEKAESGRGGGR